ncbi:MAG: hypothetical protein ACRDRX_07975 [Pseudonocardiaceae bacterium]
MPSVDREQQSRVSGQDARPVTAARMTLELLLAEVAEQVVRHEQRMATLAEQITHAVNTAADSDAAAAEVLAAHRQVRAEVDIAESERDQAILRAREATRAAQDSDERASAAEVAAEEALADLETAQLARDQALAQRDELVASVAQLHEELDTVRVRVGTVQAESDRTREQLKTTATTLTAAQGQNDQLREQLASARQEVADLAAARTELGCQLTAQRETVEKQRQRADAAEQQANRAAGQIEYLSTELSTARRHIEHWQTQAAEYHAELAGVRSELVAAQAATETEKSHGIQRLADQQARYEELIRELRTQIDQLREQMATQRQQTMAATFAEQEPRTGQRAGKEKRLS